MAIKLADTLKPMGDFPAAESSDVEITVAGGTKKSLQKAYNDGDLGGEGTNIQVTEMPNPGRSYLGKIYQYIGPTVLNNNEVEYINGFFYKCVISGGNYKWELCDVSKTKTIRTVSTLPTTDIEDAIYAKAERKFISFPTHQFVPGEDSNQSIQLMRDWLNSLRGFGFREDYDSETDQYVFRPIQRTLFLFHPTLKTYCAVIALMVHKSLNVMSYWIVSSGGSSSSQSGNFNQYDTYSFRIEYYSKQYYGGEHNTQDITPLPGITGVSDVDELPESGTIGNGIYRIRDGEVKNILCTGTFEEIKQRLIEAGFTVSDTTDPEIGIFYYQITPPGPIDVYIPDAGWFWSGQYYKLILSNTNPASIRFHTDRNTYYGIGGLDDNKNLIYRDSRKKSCYIGDSEFQKLDELGGGGVKIFYGTDEEWNALSTDEKKEYDYKVDSESGDSTDDSNFTQRVYEKVQEARRYTNNGQFVFVSNTLDSVKFDGNTYQCYSKINEAISTEYPNLVSGKILCVVVLEGTYYDIVITDGENYKRDLIITGIDKNKCIVINDESVGTGYDYAPFKIMSGNTVMNLTIRCITNSGATRAYCIHSDSSSLPYPVLIKNCILYEGQASAACIGFGTGSNSPLTIENCVMYSISGSRCLYGHNSVTRAVNEPLYIINCSGKTEGEESIYIFDANHYWGETPVGGSDDWEVHFINSTFVNGSGESPTELSSGRKGDAVDNVNYYSGHIRRMLDCSGNNNAYLNYTGTAVGKMTLCLDFNNAIPQTIWTKASFMSIYTDESSKPINAPTSAVTHWFIDSFMYGSQEIVQLAYSTHQDGAYIRRRLQGTWSEWKPMINA